MKRIAAMMLALLWLLPVAYLLSGLTREPEQTTEESELVADIDVAGSQSQGGRWVIVGKFFEPDETGSRKLMSFGAVPGEAAAYQAGETAILDGGELLTAFEDGSFYLTGETDPQAKPGEAYRTISANVQQQVVVDGSDLARAALGNGFRAALLNDLAIAAAASLLTVIFALAAAYAVAWMRVPSKGLVAVLAMLVFLPAESVLHSVSKASFGSPVLTVLLFKLAAGLPFAILLLTWQARQFPTPAMDCARIDCGADMRIFRRAILPFLKPSAYLLFAILLVWNTVDPLPGSILLPDASSVMGIATSRASAATAMGLAAPTLSLLVTALLPMLLFLLVLLRGKGRLRGLPRWALRQEEAA